MSVKSQAHRGNVRIEFLSNVEGNDKTIMTNWAKSKLAFKIAKATCSVMLDKILKTQGSKYDPLDFNQAITECDDQGEYNSELRAHTNLLRGRPFLSVNDKTELMWLVKEQKVLFIVLK